MEIAIPGDLNVLGLLYFFEFKISAEYVLENQ